MRVGSQTRGRTGLGPNEWEHKDGPHLVISRMRNTSKASAESGHTLSLKPSSASPVLAHTYHCLFPCLVSDCTPVERPTGMQHICSCLRLVLAMPRLIGWVCQQVNRWCGVTDDSMGGMTRWWTPHRTLVWIFLLEVGTYVGA